MTTDRSDTTPVTPAPDARFKRGRYLYVDALRGVAAAVVVLFHITYVTPLSPTFAARLPHWFLSVVAAGDRGVEIFFVISGFVIAHSLRRTEPGLRGAGLFIVRRQFRLDPPYWAVLFGTVALAVVQNHVRGWGHPYVPKRGPILLNMVYLQHAIRYQIHIVGVAWTLCLEIQFYILFLAILLAGSAASRTRTNPAPASLTIVVLSGMLFLVGVRYQFELATLYHGFWSYFAFGVICYYATHDLLPTWVMVTYTAVFTVATALAGPMWSYMLTGLLTALSLYAAGRTRGLRAWSLGRVTQYLGARSYSLYLVHLQVANFVGMIAMRHAHGTRAMCVLWFAVAAVSSLAVAELVYWTVEVPSMALAARFKRSKLASRPTLHGAAHGGTPE
jgi:peptidoglycan/LPS O-acetylase OafA/YrhL